MERIEQLATHNVMLEIQRSQQTFLFNLRDKGKLPSQLINLREQYKAITVKSENTYKELEYLESKEPIVLEMTKNPLDKHTKLTVERIMIDVIQATKEQEEKASRQNKYHIAFLFSQRYHNTKLDQQSGKFLEIFKYIYLNKSFFEAITQMSAYAKFLKDILPNKMKLKEFEIVALSKKCSAIF